MSISNQTYKKYSFAHHKEVYLILEETFKKFKITYYLIGANARDLQLYTKGIKPTRGTADIDFAIMIPDFNIYDTIFNNLIKQGFQNCNERYRLIYTKTNTVIDLMPYGEIEQDYTVKFTDRNIELSVLGYKEVGDSLENITVSEEDFTLPVTPIEGILILKLISYQEKPDRIKDIQDISILIKNGWEFYEEEAYEKHLDLFDNDEFDTNLAACRIIGRKMAPILARNEFLKKVILDIIKEIKEEKERTQEPEITLAKELNKNIKQVQEVFNHILLGIRDF